MTEPGTADGRLSDRDVRRPLLLGGALGVVVLAAGGYLLLSGGGQDLPVAVPEQGQAVVTSSRSPEPTAPPAAPPTTPPAAPGAPPSPVVVPVVRNPFVPLYNAAAAKAPSPAPSLSPSPAVPTARVPAAPARSPVPTELPSTPPTTGAPAASAATGPPPSAAAPYALTLVRVAGSDKAGWSAGWLVDGVAATAVPGQRFGRDGELVLLRVAGSGSTRSAVVQVGTDKPVTVKVGATVRVR